MIVWVMRAGLERPVAMFACLEPCLLAELVNCMPRAVSPPWSGCSPAQRLDLCITTGRSVVLLCHLPCTLAGEDSVL
jgi:hypothetical protein